MNLNEIMVIDIETISGYDTYEKMPLKLQEHWQKKVDSTSYMKDQSASDQYTDKAAIYAEFGKIIVIGIGIYHTLDAETTLRVKTLASHDEKDLLKRFKDLLESKFDQKKIKFCAHNGKEFDFPYLCRRMLVNGLVIPYSLNISGKKPWETPFIDTMELWKFGDRKNYTSLDLLTTLFEIPSSKTDIDGSKVSQVYYKEKTGIQKIAEYCQKDIIATAQLYLRLNNLPIIPPDHISIIT